MADTRVDPSAQKTLASLQIKHLFSRTPQLTTWIGDLNGYISQAFNNTGAFRVFQETKPKLVVIEKYLSDIAAYPNTSTTNKIDFDIIHQELLSDDYPSRKELVRQKSQAYITQLYPLLSTIYVDDFRDLPEE